MKRLVALLALASLATCFAQADPFLTSWAPTDFGNGTVGFTVFINWNDALTASGSFALSATGTNGSTIVQQTLLGINIDTEYMADLVATLDPINYSKWRDSWWDAGETTPFLSPVPPYNGVFPGSGSIGSNLFQASFGTATNTSVSGSAQILNLVLNKSGSSATGRVEGILSRAGTDYRVFFDLNFGGGGNPALGVSSNVLAFGDVRVGASGTLPLTASNTATGDLYGGYAAASGEFGPISDLVFGPIAGGASGAPRDYSYTPSARGADNGAVDVTSNGGNATVDLTGTGVGPVFADNDADDTLDFGNVGPASNPTQDVVLTISNVTTDVAAAALTDLTITGATITGADASFFSLVGSPVGSVINKDGSLAVTVRATYAGPNFVTRNAVLTLNTDEGTALGGNGADFTFNLTAVMVPEPSTGLLLAVAGLAMSLRIFRQRS